MTTISGEERTFAEDFLTYVNNSPTQFHAVDETKRRLLAAGYVGISEKSDSDFANMKAGGKYFFTRNQSSIVAFAVGGNWKPGNGFVIQAAHTDSPVFKLKPVSKITKHGYLQVGVQTYGGGLWHTWFDRDLSVAGRVIVEEKEGAFVSKLVKVDKSILRIPNLAIHLDRDIYTKGFNPNKETHCVPILCSTIKDRLNAAPKAGEPQRKKQKVAEAEEKAEDAAHHSALINVIAKELQLKPSQIRDFELCLYDTQPSALGGLYDEFICSRALDNLLMSFVTIRALVDTTSGAGDSLSTENMIRVVALFDNEEIGSNNCMGAASNMLDRVLQRVNKDSSTYDVAVRKSVLVSADMAHALHPNHPDKHEGAHRPEMHKGLVIKTNANQRYATTSVTSFLLGEIAKRNNVPLQQFVVRNDVGCGSTIGPILASNTGIRAVDVGVPQLAMHSVREMCGTADCLSSYTLMKAFFEQFEALDNSLTGTD